MNIDWGQIIAPLASFVLGVGVISAFLAKFIGKAKKYIHIAKEALDLVNAIVSALDLQPGEKVATITAPEIQRIMNDVQELRNSLTEK